MPTLKFAHMISYFTKNIDGVSRRVALEEYASLKTYMSTHNKPMMIFGKRHTYVRNVVIAHCCTNTLGSSKLGNRRKKI